MPGSEVRPLRADAQRNRDRLLAVAVRAFSEDGPDVTLESIARDAGVGIGTLYQALPYPGGARWSHVPEQGLGRLCDAAADLLQAGAAGPGDAGYGWTGSSTT